MEDYFWRVDGRWAARYVFTINDSGNLNLSQRLRLSEQGPLKIPSRDAEATISFMIIQTIFFCPLSYCLSFTIHCVKHVRGHIVALSPYGGPAAIFGGIIAIVIFTLYRPAFGAFAHVGKKVFKGISPAITDLDAAPAVSIIMRSILSVATGFYTLPYTIGERAALTMRGLDGGPYFDIQTTARLRFTRYQRRALHFLDAPTFTFTKPQGFFGLTSCIAQNLQPIKGLILHVFEARFSWFGKKLNGILIVGHFFSFSENLIKVVRASNLCQPFDILA